MNTGEVSENVSDFLIFKNMLCLENHVPIIREIDQKTAQGVSYVMSVFARFFSLNSKASKLLSENTYNIHISTSCKNMTLFCVAKSFSEYMSVKELEKTKKSTI